MVNYEENPGEMRLSSTIWPKGQEWPWPDVVFQKQAVSTGIYWVVDNGSFMEIRNTGAEEIGFYHLEFKFEHGFSWNAKKDLNCEELYFLTKPKADNFPNCFIGLGDSLKVDLTEDQTLPQEF